MYVYVHVLNCFANNEYLFTGGVLSLNIFRCSHFTKAEVETLLFLKRNCKQLHNN